MFKQEKFILFILCLVYVLIFQGTYSPSIHSLGIMGWLGLLQLVYCIISWLKRGNQFVSPYIIFLITLYVFSFGQSFLWAFGLNFERTLIGFYDITIPDIFLAQVVTLIMLAFFHIGATSYLAKHKTYKTNSYSIVGYSKKLKTIGWILFIVSIVPYISETTQNLVQSMTRGYGSLFEGGGEIGIANMSNFIAGYFIPSIICLFIAYKDNFYIRNFLLGIVLFNILVILFTGGRSNAVILIAVFLILYNYLIKRFTKKWLIVGAISVFALLQVLSFIGSIRTDERRTAGFDGMKIESNAAIDAVAEMGTTMFCLIKTMDLVPSKEPYRYGKSYVYSFTSLIPNLGFWDVHPAKRESNLSDWLTESLGLGYGTGFSMCAEAYANFGYFGILLFFFWGWFIASLFGRIEHCVRTQNYALFAFLIILFWYFLKLPRNNFINLVRPLFFVAGPIYLYCTSFLIKKIK